MKKEKLLTIITIILGILLVGTTGFICYDKIANKNNTKNNCNCPECKVCETNNNQAATSITENLLNNSKKDIEYKIYVATEYGKSLIDNSDIFIGDYTIIIHDEKYSTDNPSTAFYTIMYASSHEGPALSGTCHIYKDKIIFYAENDTIDLLSYFIGRDRTINKNDNSIECNFSDNTINKNGTREFKLVTE